MLTPLDVVDTAVKVGLGAAIAGFFSWLVGRSTHRDQITRERANRRADLLERTSVETQQFTRRFNNVMMVLHERHLERPLPPDVRAAVCRDIMSAVERLTKARALAALLAEAELTLALKTAVNVAIDLYNSVYYGGGFEAADTFLPKVEKEVKEVNRLLGEKFSRV